MPLLEREQHLAQLASSMDRTLDGWGGVVLVSGEAGIGKTSLLQQFAAQHGQASIYWGGCEALFTPHPLAPLYDIARQVGGDFHAAIAACKRRHDIFNLTLDRLMHLRRPAAVIVEDAHWADEATLDLIKFLGRRLQRLGVLLVVSYRDDELHDKHPLRGVIGDIPSVSLSRIRLPSLTKAAVERLAEAAGRPADGLHEMTSGNAFFVTEVLAAPGDEVPVTVRDAVIARLARLSDPARKVAHLVSIIPGRTEHRLVERIAAPDGATLTECLNAGMLAHPDHSLGFRHELARRAVEDSLSPTERRELNAVVLATLSSEGEDQVPPARLVHHADKAGDVAAVLRLAPIAAQRAAAVGAHRGAAALLGTALRHGSALDEATRAGLLERYSYECYLTDQVAEAIEMRQAALALWHKAGVTIKVGDNLRWLSRFCWFDGRNADAERYGVEAVQVLESLPPGRELAMAYSNRSQLRMLTNDAAAAVEWGQKALAIAEPLDDVEVQTHALNNIGTARYAEGDVGGLGELERALKIALEHGFDEHVARAYVNLTINTVWRHDFSPAAMERLEEGFEYCEARDLDSWSSYIQAYRGEAKLGIGQWNDASRDANAIASCQASAAVIKIPAFVTVGRLRARRGDPDMETPLAEAYRLAVLTGEPQRLAPALAARAEAAWLRGSDANEILETLAAAYHQTLKHSHIWMRGEMAFWLWRHGRLEQIPANIPEPYALQMRGDWQGAARAWEELSSPYEQASALADSDEEPALRTALEIFERLGAEPMAGIVRRKLRASGVRGIRRGPQERTRQNPHGMTNQELKVLALLMEGRRNADIARTLFVSEKTVGHHVSAVLAKLGVKSRGEAAAAAAGLGLGISTAGKRAAGK